MKKDQRRSFKRNPIAASIVLAMASQLPINVAYGNAGYGTNTDISGKTIAVPTFFANSPQGLQPALDPYTHLPSINPATGSPWSSAAEALAAGAPMVDTGKPMRKFVDALPGVDSGGPGAGIPLAITEKWFNPITNTQTQDDYFEFAIVQYTQRMHSDLPKETTLRGYVQIETPAVAAGLADAAGVKSEHIALTYPDGTAIKDINGNPVYAVHKPSYLGPIVVASRGTPVRIKYYNYLPYTDKDGKSVGAPNGGEIPLPVDEYIAGGGPVQDAQGNPVKDQNGQPIKFPQNRVSIHWHGGDAPWISDGTPHQWIAPAGDAAYSITDSTHPYGLGKGDAVQNVPDMPDPGPGAETLYWPMNLSARLMFYHDHTSGETKINVYEGEAAGLVVVDPVEQKLVSSGIIPGTLLGVGIPLIIQDKTFVPQNIGANPVDASGNPVQSQDAKWALQHWGQPGDLWFPHVYEVNQDPNSIDATNPVGRWDWGPWFWPVFPAQYSLPSGEYGDVTATPEAFVDTSVVNGMAYPTVTVDPIAYRFRLLSVGNDRTLNLGLYQAVDANGVVCDAAANPNPAVAAPAPGQTDALAACTELRMVPAAPTSNLPDGWPTDGRAGGVPDPLTAGPDIIQIGNEAGLLPAPAIWKAQPISFEQNVRKITIYNMLRHQLLLMPAERADVIVDFSKYAGKTLILYNDAPAPAPGLDPRVDYYTGVGDQTPNGGAYDTLPGYGPNTRTVMQIKVNSVASGATPAAPFNVAALQAALPTAYAASQAAPIIPESAYNTAFNTNDTDNYARIFTGSASQPAFTYTQPSLANQVQIGTVDPKTGLLTLANSVVITNPGAGYQSAPTVTVTGGGGSGATAVATIGASGRAKGQVTSVTITNGGSGFTSDPVLTFSGGGADTQATASVVTVPAAQRIRVINKAIQELFDPVYGRMNATLAVELPYSSATIATTIPLAYIDAPIDSIDGIKDGETQIWKVTHNGVDAHPVHFHLVNVQVINRVAWDGVVMPPEANELGWKETLRMDPLEDVYVAVKAVHPITPFGLPKSQRVLDPSQSVGSQLGFTQIDQLTGQGPTFQTYLKNGLGTSAVNVATTAYSNQLTDFDNEYVWHCHILGHEENDFMRPFIFHPDVVVPDAPGSVAASGNSITWTDPTPFGGQDSNGIPTAGINANYTTPYSNPKNEVGFRVQQQTAPGVFTTVATVPANSTSWTDDSGLFLNAGTAAQFTVTAYNAAGESAQGVPSALGAATGAVGSTADAAGATASGIVFTPGTVGSGGGGGNVPNNAPALDALAFSGANPGTTAGAISLTWANNPSNGNNVTGFTLSWTQDNGTPASATFASSASRGATVTELTPSNSYTFTLVANAPAGNSPGVSITITAP